MLVEDEVLLELVSDCSVEEDELVDKLVLDEVLKLLLELVSLTKVLELLDVELVLKFKVELELSLLLLLELVKLKNVD